MASLDEPDDETPPPPEPDGAPVVGHTLSFLIRPFEFRERMAREHGDIVVLDVATFPMYMITGPEYIKRVFTTREKFGKPDFFEERFSPTFGNGLLISEGAFWQRQRRHIQQGFLLDKLLQHGDEISAVTADHCADWPERGRRQIHAEMGDLTLDIALRTMFSTDLGDELQRYRIHTANIYKRFQTRKQIFPRWVPTPTTVRHKRGIREVEDLVMEIVRDHRRQDEPPNDLVTVLLNLQERFGLSETQLRDELLTILLGGHETTATALSFLFYLLAEHPDVQQRLQREVDSVLGGERPIGEDLNRLPYTRKVIKESMRVYPPAHSVQRSPTEDIELGGYAIPEGSNLFMPQWVVHRDERWYDDPEAFRPERWTDEFESRLPEYAYFPFGGGPRQCIGKQFSLIEIQLVAATLVQRYSFEPIPGEEPTLMAGLTIGPKDGLALRVERRA